MVETVLSLQGLSKNFGALAANNEVNLDLKQGEIHALIGPNGAGKSTLIKQIAGEITPDAGAVYFAGQNLNAVRSVKRVRAGLGRTFQVSSLITEFTVEQNLMLAVMGAQQRTFRFFKRFTQDATLRQQAQHHLEQLGLQGRSDVRVSQLSHGERRQLEMAMALALKPKALLLDEPMAGIGPGGTKEMTDLLARLKAQVPILLVEHDMAAVFALADRISVLVYGRIILTGTAEEIRNSPQVQQAYLGEEAP